MIPKRTAAAERGKEDLESAAEEGLWRFEEGKRCGGAVERWSREELRGRGTGHLERK
ncbi:BnaCnng04990D [Brassica napus]|uniref:BnaCnng04990D protein n=1 Tax=Brassica napus TaxID=3708 RepID=A0A078GRV5_BRANA|nr:BnaCnng04990D [Brassica napus]